MEIGWFHYEPCCIAKLKRTISHALQIRSKNAWDLYHTAIQLIKPIGYGGIEYYLEILPIGAGARCVGDKALFFSKSTVIHSYNYSYYPL